MRWFQVDSDTPHDPRISMLVKALGPAGIGGLFMLWCHIANHGARKPGWSLNTAGKPMPRFELVDASGLSSDDFDRMVAILVENGHFSRREWETRKVIVVPAMSTRADTYTKRRVRTGFAQGSKNVPLQDSTSQANTKNPPTPLAHAKGARVTREVRKQAKEILRLRFGHCHHDPACSDGAACLLAVIREIQAKAS